MGRAPYVIKEAVTDRDIGARVRGTQVKNLEGLGYMRV